LNTRMYNIQNISSLQPPVQGKPARKIGSTVDRRATNDVRMVLTSIITNFNALQGELKKVQMMVQQTPNKVVAVPADVWEKIQTQIPELRSH
ncbi:MAG: hypothetical protein ACRDE2_12630, partial [Chitinophagaceae bacterium]